MKKLMLSLAAIFIAGFIFGQGVSNTAWQNIYIGNHNFTTIDQDGFSNFARQDVLYGDYNDLWAYQHGYADGWFNISYQFVYQGDFNDLDVEQIYWNNYADQYVQYGDENVLEIFQEGIQNWAYQDVIGYSFVNSDENNVYANQDGTLNRSQQTVHIGSLNDLDVWQEGDYNYAWQYVTGNENTVFSDQFGDRNQSRQNVYGDLNLVENFQVGEDNNNHQYVIGDENEAYNNQDGYWNVTTQDIFGDGNDVSTVQGGGGICVTYPYGYDNFSDINVGVVAGWLPYYSSFNTVDHWQQGYYNEAKSDVLGDGNTAYVRQIGGAMGNLSSANFAYTGQFGFGQDAEILQGVLDFPYFGACPGWTGFACAKPGYGNDAAIVQYGWFNDAKIHQGDYMEGSWTWMNIANIEQDGWFNFAEIYQIGDVNDFDIYQDGNYNEALAVGHGSFNTVDIDQYGTVNDATVFIGFDNLWGMPTPLNTPDDEQYNDITVYQDGFNNDALVWVVGEYNTFSVTQEGNNNIAGYEFGGTACPANDYYGFGGVRIWGDFNEGYINQQGNQNFADVFIKGDNNTTAIDQY